jgi:membrane protein DedA with SNARE-associated domain
VTLSPADWPGGLAYGVVFLAALIEGEVVFIAAAALAGQGSLDPLGVVAAGAMGAACGDQIPFYLLRYRVRSWLDRLPAMQRVSGTLVDAIRRRRALLPFLIRFAPGLRIAIASACAYADVPPLIFSTCSVLGALVWATCIVGVVGWLGPEWLSRLGVSGWSAVVGPALVLLILLKSVAWARRQV